MVVALLGMWLWALRYFCLPACGLWIALNIFLLLLLISRVSTRATEFLTGVFHSFSYIVLCNTAALHFAMVWIYLCAHTRDLNQPMSIPIYYFISYFFFSKHTHTHNHWLKKPGTKHHWLTCVYGCLRQIPKVQKPIALDCEYVFFSLLLFI